MRAIKLLLTALLILGATGVASAQGTLDWSGVHVGGHAGYLMGSSDVTTSTATEGSDYFATSSIESINARGKASLSPGGIMAGVTAGYDLQKGAMVYGLEVTAGVLPLKDDRTITVVYPDFGPTSYTIQQTTEASTLVTLRARAGRMLGNDLASFFVGLAMGTVKIDDKFSDTYATAAEAGSESSTQTGWTVGGGFEHAMNGGWSATAEVLYVDLGEVSIKGGTLTAFSPPQNFPNSPFTHTATLSGAAIKLGLNFRY